MRACVRRGVCRAVCVGAPLDRSVVHAKVCWSMCIIVITMSAWRGRTPLPKPVHLASVRHITVTSGPMIVCIVMCFIIHTLFMLSVTLASHRAIVIKLVHTMVIVLGLLASERLGAV